MSIETDVQARIADIQSRAAAVTVTASALEQQVANQPPPQTDTITIEVGNNSIIVTAAGITISGPVTFSDAVDLPAGSTVNGQTIITADVYNVHTHGSGGLSASSTFNAATNSVSTSISGSTAAP